MKIKKSLAGVAAFSIAAAGIGIVAAPSASAASIDLVGTVQSEPVNDAGVAAYNTNFAAGINSASLTAAQVGTNVELSITLGVGPKAGFAAVGAGSYQYEFDIVDTTTNTIVLSGDQCETNAALSAAVAIGGNYSGIGPGKDIPTLVCTVPSPAAGVHTYDIRNMNTNGNGPSSGSGFGAPYRLRRQHQPVCRPGRDEPRCQLRAYVRYRQLAGRGVCDADLRTISVNSTSGQTVASYGRGAGAFDPDGRFGPASPIPFAGQTVTLGFNNAWGAGSATVELCNAASTSTGCQAVGTVTLTGAAETKTVVLPAGLTTGLRNLVVTDPINAAKKRGTAYTILGARTLALVSTSFGPGTSVGVSGSNWNTGETVALGGILGSPTFAATADAAAATATGTGSFSGSITINDPATFAVTATSIAQAPAGASVAVTINQDQCTSDVGNTNTGSCNTKQNIFATVQAGDLSQQATAAAGNPNATSIALCKTAAPTVDPGGTQLGDTAACRITSQVSAANMYGTLNPVTVTDARGGTFGWDLTATMPNLSDGTHSIANGNLSITPTCASTNANSAPGISSGSAAQTFSGTVTLCGKTTAVGATSQTSGGVWQLTAPLTLNVPAFQAAGEYNSTITVLLT